MSSTPPKPALLDADTARKELAETTMEAIERATARTWGGRALASYQLCLAEQAAMANVRRFCDGEAFRQEAFEHAAMAEDGGVLLRGIQVELDAARAKALAALQLAVDNPTR